MQTAGRDEWGDTPVLLVVGATEVAYKHLLARYHALCGMVGPLPPPRVLNVDCQTDAREGLEAAIARAVAGRWDLHRLERQQPTLENIFLRYVSQAPGEARVQ